MNNKLKNGLLGISILLLFFLAFSQSCIAEENVPPAPPMLPMTVTGVALIDGTPAPNGTVVAAYLNEMEYLANTSFGNYSLLFLVLLRMKENWLLLRWTERTLQAVFPGKTEV